MVITCLSAQAPVADGDFDFPDHSLRISIPSSISLLSDRKGKGEQHLHSWSSTMGDFRLKMSLWVVPRQEWGLYDPFDVSANVAMNQRQRKGNGHFRFEEEYAIPGAFGTLPYGVIASSGRWDGTERIATDFVLAGLTENKGYTFRLACEPAPDKKTRKGIEGFLKTGISYYGKTEDPEWEEEEALQRWEQDRPEELAGKLKIVRTEHYIIFTDSSSGKLFAKKMEECYDSIQETFEFPEVKGRKLMPVFLFRTKQEYVDYYAKIAGIPKDQAANSKGHAWRDYYATYYDSPVDPVHIHEATHQIFANRLRLGGGGSWFQEGVAELMSTSKNERKGYARNAARSENWTPFREFFVIPSLLHSAGKSSTGENQAGNHYLQAASIIDFARHSKFGKKKFDQFLEAVGSLPRGDLDSIEAALRKVYDTDIAGFEAEWADYWD
jgi:hypothetical protein